MFISGTPDATHLTTVGPERSLVDKFDFDLKLTHSQIEVEQSTWGDTVVQDCLYAY